MKVLDLLLGRSKSECGDILSGSRVGKSSRLSSFKNYGGQWVEGALELGLVDGGLKLTEKSEGIMVC